MQTKNVLFYVVLASLVFSVILPLGSSLVSASAASGATVTAYPNVLGPGDATLLNTSANAFTGGVVSVYLSTNAYATITGATLIASNVPLSSNHEFVDQNITIPASTALGTYYLKVTDDNGATVVVSNPIEVLTAPYAPTLTLTPDAATAGSSVKFCGTNYVPNEPATVFFIGPNAVVQETVTTTTSSGGVCQGTFQVPLVPAGTYLVVARTHPLTTSGYNVTPVSTGASELFTVLPSLDPGVQPYLLPSATKYFSIIANSAGASLFFFGAGLPVGNVVNYNDIPVYNSQNVQVGYGVMHPASVGSNGEFTGQYVTTPTGYQYPAVNVTFVTGFPSGAGYYAVFDIGGVMVESQPFIVSTPTNGNFQAVISPTSGSGVVSITVTAFDLAANSAVSATNFFTGGGTADPNGAIVFTITANNGEDALPNGTYPVSIQDAVGQGTVTLIPAYYTAVPSFEVVDQSSGQSYGAVGDTVLVTAPSPSSVYGSLPTPFQATSVTFTSMANGYTVTVTNLASGTSIAAGNYESDSYGFFTGFTITLPALPAGPVSVTLNGATTGGKPVSIPGGSFIVVTSILAIYWANPKTDSWVKVTSSTQLFPGDIIDVQISGFPVNETASLTFSTPRFAFEVNAIPISGSTPSQNGNVELVVYVPFSAPFGLYDLLINNAYGAVSPPCVGTQFYIGSVIGTTLTLVRPGQYTSSGSTVSPHVYIDPMDVVPESVTAATGTPPFQNMFYPGTTVFIFGTGFTQSAKLFVTLNDSALSNSPLTLPISLVNLTSSQYGIFNATVNLPQIPSYYYISSAKGWVSINYSVGVYQSNPSSIVQTLSTAFPIHKVDSTNFTALQNITVTPTSGPVNTTVTLTGSGFAAGEFVGIYVQSVTIIPPGVQAVGADGSFTVTFNIPAYATGPVNIVAEGSSKVTEASTSFTITAPPQFTVTVSGASTLQQYENELINVYTDLNGSPVSATVTGTILNPNGVSQSLSFVSNGVGAYYAIVNATIPGTYSVTVSATYQGITKTVPFSFGVIPRTTTTPTNNSAISSISSAVSSALAELGALQTALSSLQNSLSQLSSNVAAQIATLGSSLAVLSSSLSAISSSVNTAQLYSLGALIVAFIALIVIIYGVLIRRRM